MKISLFLNQGHLRPNQDPGNPGPFSENLNIEFYYFLNFNILEFFPKVPEVIFKW